MNVIASFIFTEQAPQMATFVFRKKKPEIVTFFATDHTDSITLIGEEGKGFRVKRN